MKKLVFASLLSTFAIASAQADTINVGCGLGSMVFDGKTDKVSQILAVTTNGTSGNQTFGISSNTLGCKADGRVKSYAAVSTFMTANIDKVAHDMAMGQGESMETLAALMGMNEEHKARFFTVSKNHFDQIFSSTQTTSEEAIDALAAIMARDEVLAQYTL
ncbi:MAG TPA: DUF3015 domain-containing protein [Gammaproteobacteria bacterium]|nr:DUF3015 domain-containing protein [Gammaproteobacteria bacterium]